MSEREDNPKLNPDPGWPTAGETLPEDSEPQGKASLRKGKVETERPKAGKGGQEAHGAGEHDDPDN
jgi:hypothetical protein